MSKFRKQGGAILVTSLLLLLVLTVLGLAVMRMTRMQERMAGNSRDVGLAFQGAEAALRHAEARLNLTVRTGPRPNPVPAFPCNLPDVCIRGVLPVGLADQTNAWWAANGTVFLVGGTTRILGLFTDPQYVIEEIGLKPNDLLDGHDPDDDYPVYQITAHSTGASNQTNTVLQSTYALPPP